MLISFQKKLLYVLRILAVTSCLLLPLRVQAASSLQGVNIELWDVPRLDQPEGKLRVALNSGFNLVRIGIVINPWLFHDEKHKDESRRRLVRLLSSTEAKKLVVYISLVSLAGSGGATADQIVCGDASLRERFVAAYIDILSLIPDRQTFGIEPLNEPPRGCGSGDASGFRAEWLDLQNSLYIVTRARKQKLKFLVSGGLWGLEDGILSFDPLKYRGDINAIITFHYYEPFLFTHQGTSYPGQYNMFVEGVPWPNEPSVLSMAEARARRNIGEATGVYDKAAVEADLDRAFSQYAVNGTDEYLVKRLTEVAAWARRNKIPSSRIFVGEVGVARRPAGIKSQPQEYSGAYLRRVGEIIQRLGFDWAVWDLEKGFAFLCQSANEVRVCSAYSHVLQGRR